VLILSDFKDFPATEVTVEFWMWSSDGCREGTPFSYAAGDYAVLDNAFDIFNYNEWWGPLHGRAATLAWTAGSAIAFSMVLVDEGCPSNSGWA
jgi:hypothetical protein